MLTLTLTHEYNSFLCQRPCQRHIANQLTKLNALRNVEYMDIYDDDDDDLRP